MAKAVPVRTRGALNKQEWVPGLVSGPDQQAKGEGTPCSQKTHKLSLGLDRYSHPVWFFSNYKRHSEILEASCWGLTSLPEGNVEALALVPVYVGIYICMWKLLSCVQLFVIPWTVDFQATKSMGFSMQECLSGLPFPSPGDLPAQGSDPGLPNYRQALYCLSYQRSLSTCERGLIWK